MWEIRVKFRRGNRERFHTKTHAVYQGCLEFEQFDLEGRRYERYIPLTSMEYFEVEVIEDGEETS